MNLSWLGVIAVVAILLLVPIANHIHSRWVYRPTRTQVAELLSRALAGTAKEGELDYFICLPVSHDPLLEQIRNEFGRLFGPSAFKKPRSPGEEPPWTPAVRERVEAMIETLNSATHNPAAHRTLRDEAAHRR